MNFRKFSNNIIIRFLLVIVIISFILWGIGDIIRNSVNNDIVYIKNIGGISKEEFRHFLRNEIIRFERLGGEEISENKAYEMGIDKIILNELISAKFLKNIAEELKINISQEKILDHIANDKLFKNNEGKFDKDIFRKLLQENNLTENIYLKDLKRILENQIIIETFGNNNFTDKFYSPITKFRSQIRIAEEYIINAEKILLSSYDEDNLKKFYNEHMGEFLSPEKRDISFIILNYDYNEKNQLENIENIISEGENILAINKKFGGEIKNLNNVSENDLISKNDDILSNKKFIENAFNLSAGSISDIIEISGKMVILEVDKIIGKKIEDFKEAKQDIVKIFEEKDKLNEIDKYINIIKNSNKYDLDKPDIISISEKKFTYNDNNEINSNIFNLKKGEFTKTFKIDKNKYAIYKVKNIIYVEPNSEMSKKVIQELNQIFPQMIINELLEYKLHEHPVTYLEKN